MKTYNYTHTQSKKEKPTDFTHQSMFKGVEKN